MPIESIDLKTGTPLIFKHPAINRKLVIGTGMSGIQWAYRLNTNVQSTYGGEVVQVLSAYVDSISVHGQTTDNVQLRQIADWFLEYMQLAGLHNRNEQYITMEYPERGWSFWIQVTQLPNFHYNRDEIAIEWQITAEIVADNDTNYLSQMTMSQYTESAFDPSMWDLKFMEGDPRNQEHGLDPVSLGHQVGDNFQSLLGAWASGDFAHFAFDATASTSANRLKNSKEYWTQLFGTDTFNVSGSGQGGGAGGSNVVGGSSTALSAEQNTFAQDVAGQTGLSFAVVAAWVKAEGNGGGAHNWLNVSAKDHTHTYSGVPMAASQSGQFSAFQNVADAAKETAYWINQFSNFHGIKASATGSDQDQLRAIWQSPWDAGHYGGNGVNLINAYNSIKNTIRESSGNPKGATAVRYALSQLGVPYHFGAESPGAGFDCSGLCQWAYSKAGVAIPRDTYGQIAFCHQVNVQNIAVGDLVFCNFGTERPPGHVVMYIGNGEVVAAPQTGQVVSKDKLSNFQVGGAYGCNFFQVGRVP